MEGFVVVAPNLFVIGGMTVVRLCDASVIVINPKQLQDNEFRELNKIGLVRLLVWTCRVHLFKREWLTRYPDAKAARPEEVPFSRVAWDEGNKNCAIFFETEKILTGGDVVWRKWFARDVIVTSVASIPSLKAELVVLANGTIMRPLSYEVVVQRKDKSALILSVLFVFILFLDVVWLYRCLYKENAK
jgi:hypothetical protein